LPAENDNSIGKKEEFNLLGESFFALRQEIAVRFLSR